MYSSCKYPLFISKLYIPIYYTNLYSISKLHINIKNGSKTNMSKMGQKNTVANQ